MNISYTDVDRLMLERWADINALFEAHGELLGRITETIDSVSNRVGMWLEEHGYDWQGNEKRPSIWAWKPEWEKPRGEPLIKLEIGDFAPAGFGRVEQGHPWAWVITDGLERIKLKEPDRIRFARDVKTALGPSAAKWQHHDEPEDAEPLGRYYTDLTDADRVALVSHPVKLVEFLQAGFTELFEVVPALSSTLVQYRGSR